MITLPQNTLLAKKIRMILISGKKCVQKLNRPKFLSLRNFKHPKILQYSKTTLVSQNKPDVIRKGLEMAGIVEALTKELEQEDLLKLLS